MKASLFGVLDAALVVIAMLVGDIAAVILISFPLFALGRSDLWIRFGLDVQLIMGFLAGAVYVGRAPDILKRRKRRRVVDTIFWLLSFSVLYIFGAELFRPPYSIQAAVLVTIFDPLAWALFVFAAVRNRVGNAQPSSPVVPVADGGRKLNDGDGRPESGQPYAYRGLVAPFGRAMNTARSFVSKFALKPKMTVIAVFSFELRGPRAWHPNEEKHGPVPASLYQDDDVRQLQDYYVDGKLAPLWLREHFDFPPGELGHDSALSLGWLTLLENQIGKLPRHLQDFVLRSIQTEVSAYYDTKLASPLRDLRRDAFDLGTVSVTVHQGARLMATVKTTLTHMRDVDLVALVLALSFGSVARALSGDQLGWFMFLTSYGLWKWKNEKQRGDWSTSGRALGTSQTWTAWSKRPSAVA